jgi:predicted membrane GTPase involved in stress response
MKRSAAIRQLLQDTISMEAIPKSLRLRKRILDATARKRAAAAA